MGADGGGSGGLPRHMTHGLKELDKLYTIPRRPEGAGGVGCPSKPAKVLEEFPGFRGICVKDGLATSSVTHNGAVGVTLELLSALRADSPAPAVQGAPPDAAPMAPMPNATPKAQTSAEPSPPVL